MQQCCICKNDFIHEKGWIVNGRIKPHILYEYGRYFVCTECAPTKEEAYALLNYPNDVVKEEWIKGVVETYRKNYD